MINACSFVTIELRLLEVDVVDDLRERLERRVLEVEGAQHHLERTEIPFMGKLGVEHVEAQFARSRYVAARGNELEGGRLVDKSANEPSAGDAIDMYALSGHPGSFLRLRNGE